MDSGKPLYGRVAGCRLGDLCTINEEYAGECCQCADCCHVPGVCIDIESGGGCCACDGPVDDCEFYRTPQEKRQEEDA